MTVGIVGRGRLGRSLAALLVREGVDVALFGRSEAPHGDVVLLAVPDAAIASVALPVGIVLHCSGATGVDVLRPHHPAGSWHPLMTFPGPEVSLPDLTGVPVALAGDPEAIDAGRWIASKLRMEPFEVPGDRRLYHAAAVMAGNFATVLLADASRVLAAAGVDPAVAPRLLAPLALRSITNAVDDPARALTGPIARGDHAVLDGHRAALREAGLDGVLAAYDALCERARALMEEGGKVAEDSRPAPRAR